MRTPIQESFAHLEGMKCFACAPKRLNAMGLDLVFEETEDGAATRFSLPAHFQSYPGFLHGGIVATVLDETMAYAGVFKRHVLPFTRTLQLGFRQGVQAEKNYWCSARITDSSELRFSAKGVIEDEKGRSLVVGEGEFAVPSFAMAKRMLGQADLEEFKDFFR